jgi:hypothetical protein
MHIHGSANVTVLNGYDEVNERRQNERPVLLT